jgi:photosystem II stability/assembly factor-like uncharacterized protein
MMAPVEYAPEGYENRFAAYEENGQENQESEEESDGLERIAVELQRNTDKGDQHHDPCGNDHWSHNEEGQQHGHLRHSPGTRHLDARRRKIRGAPERWIAGDFEDLGSWFACRHPVVTCLSARTS